MKKNFIFISFMCVILVGCNKPATSTDSSDDVYARFNLIDSVAVSEDYVIHARIRYYNFDQVENLTAFFDEISIRHPLAFWHEDYPVKENALKCINKIDAYRKGVAKYFPDSLVHDCISTIGFELAYVDNHGCDSIDLCFLEWFMMCAAFYSPDITCLVETQTPNHCAGFNNVGHFYNSAPWWPYVILRRDKGYEVVHLRDYEKVEKVFELCDDNNQRYYLYSNNSLNFHQWLFWEQSDEKFLMVAECSDINAVEGANCYYFSRENMAWKYARLSSDRTKLTAVGDKFAKKLKLDGFNSKFLND